MKVTIRSISILQAGKLLAVLYAFCSLIFLPFVLIGMLFNPAEMLIMLCVMLLYPIIGFIGGIFMAVVYNVAAHFVGGFEITLDGVEKY